MCVSCVCLCLCVCVCVSVSVCVLTKCVCVCVGGQPPTGLQANLKRSFRTFAGRQLDDLDMRSRGVLFGLCYFHSVMTERRRFGPIGFNRRYPFSASDLLSAAAVMRNYMDYSPRMPWEDLRYLFGEIMYGGHITDDFDRRLCGTYLSYYLNDDLLDEKEMFPFLPDGERLSFRAPVPTSFDKYVEVIDSSAALASNSPLAFGLHPNAEIGYRTNEATELFQLLADLQPARGAAQGDAEAVEHIADGLCQDLLEEFRDVTLDLEYASSRGLQFGGVSLDGGGKGGSRGDDGSATSPFVAVFLQECAAFNTLVGVMVKSLAELEQGLRGELQLSGDMDALMAALYTDRVPKLWEKAAYPSMRPLGGWLRDLRHRWQQLTEWIEVRVVVLYVVVCVSVYCFTFRVYLLFVVTVTVF